MHTAPSYWTTDKQRQDDLANKPITDASDDDNDPLPNHGGGFQNNRQTENTRPTEEEEQEDRQGKTR